MTSAFIDLDGFEFFDEEPTNLPTPASPSIEPRKNSIRYLRVSTRGQMDTDSDVVADGNSIDSQRRATTAKELALGLTNVDEYSNRETPAKPSRDAQSSGNCSPGS